MTPLLAGELMQSYKERPEQRRSELSTLTPRQREVLHLLTKGHSAKEIASILNISARTVEFHKYRMLNELGLKSSAELIRYAIKEGIATQ
jgi:DNA-binding NarL/FixJ family response regulator